MCLIDIYRDLSHNSITSILAGGFNIASNGLLLLNISMNTISQVPANAFSSLAWLSTLDLSSNAISTVASGAWSSLTALGYLSVILIVLVVRPFIQIRSLENNQLTVLTDNIFTPMTKLVAM